MQSYGNIHLLVHEIQKVIQNVQAVRECGQNCTGTCINIRCITYRMRKIMHTTRKKAIFHFLIHNRKNCSQCRRNIIHIVTVGETQALHCSHIPVILYLPPRPSNAGIDITEVLDRSPVDILYHDSPYPVVNYI